MNADDVHSPENPAVFGEIQTIYLSSENQYLSNMFRCTCRIVNKAVHPYDGSVAVKIRMTAIVMTGLPMITS